MTKFTNLFEPMDIRGYTYRNRIISAPTLFAHSVLFLPEIKENVYRMVENRAKGGSAAVSTGEISVNAEEAKCLFLDRGIDFTKYEGEDFDAIKEYADRIKKHGAIAYLEFCHEGSRSEAEAPYQPWGPDAYTREDGVEVKAMDKDMMKKVCNDYYNISKFAREAGFDGVLVHGGHGFNMQQFISPWTNHRTDEFGGSMENRARFPKMLLEAVREGIGDDRIVELRISAEDGDGDMTIDDTVEFCKEIDGMVDIIHVSNGLKWAGNRTQTFSDFFDIHGVNVEHAAKIKDVVKESKVAVIGGINSPELAEEIIKSGKADFVELGRQGFADPEFANKAKNGQEDKIRRCVRCFNCYPGFCEHKTDVPLWEKGLPKEEVDKIYSPASMGQCAINPNSGFGHYEDRYPLPKSSKKVLIIGGGIGGLQAALTAAERGHQVTLVEKTDKLGGIINFTDKDNDKIDLRNFKDMLIKEVLDNPKITVFIKKTADKELIDEINPDNVIINVGSEPIVAPIPGIETAMNALDSYYRADELGKNIILVGGGLVGCETGLFLADFEKNVSVVEMQDMMAFETFGYYRNALMDEMDKRNVEQYLGAKCLEIKPDGVRIEQNGEEKFLSADSVVYSMGMKSKSKLAEQLKEDCGDREVILIGDCVKPGKLGDAVRSGYLAALKIV